jgi:hypothetical protein
MHINTETLDRKTNKQIILILIDFIQKNHKHKKPKNLNKHCHCEEEQLAKNGVKYKNCVYEV